MVDLKKLIKENCPEGVEYKTLGEIATEIYRGNGVTNSQIGTGDYPCTTPGSITNAFSIWFEKCNFGIEKELIKNPKYFEKGNLLFVASSQVIKNIGNCCAYVGNEKCIAGGDILVLKHQQNPKYLSYALSSEKAKIQKEKLSSGIAVFHIYSSSLSKIKIPLPPLEIQEKIADTLDNLRDHHLKQKLEKELKLRKSQYEFYRDKLISESTTELKSLGEIATEIHKNELTINKESVYAKEGIPCVTLFEVLEIHSIEIKNRISYLKENLKEDEKFCSTGDLLVTQRGHVFEQVGTPCAYLGEEDCMVDGRIFILKHKQNPKYLAYALSTFDASIQKQKYLTGTFYPSLSNKTVKKFKIPLPSLEVQEEIVRKLDILRERYNSLKEKLPRLIELNRKRYEYYRDLIIDEYLTNSEEVEI